MPLSTAISATGLQSMLREVSLCSEATWVSWQGWPQGGTEGLVSGQAVQEWGGRTAGPAGVRTHRFDLVEFEAERGQRGGEALRAAVQGSNPVAGQVKHLQRAQGGKGRDHRYAIVGQDERAQVEQRLHAAHALQAVGGGVQGLQADQAAQRPQVHDPAPQRASMLHDIWHGAGQRTGCAPCEAR